MLKLPKGLKKKKKGHKSKKDKELFTEEELNQYRREHQHDQEFSSAAGTSAVASSAEEDNNPNKGAVDEEWSKFAALTTGVDSILKKTQGDLDRIKKESFFQRVPPKSENKNITGQQNREGQDKLAAEATPAEERDIVQELISAVVQISESEGETDDEEDIFDTNYTDAIASGELALAYVPESPEEEQLEGPDPFDTSYADKIIKGPEVSKKGKRIVHIGSAVEVLTGRIENVSNSTPTSARRPRRGPKNLLLQSFEESNDDNETVEPKVKQQEQVKSLLDDNDDLVVEDTEIDLSVSLHLRLQKAAETEASEKAEQEFEKQDITSSANNIFVVKSELEQNWSELEGESVKPCNISPTINLDEDDEFVGGSDPFDTAFVDRVLPADYDDDFDPRAEDDFDPRADEEVVPVPDLPQQTHSEVVEVKQTVDFLTKADEQLDILNLVRSDLLSGSNCDLSEIIQAPLAPANNPEISFDDPFDTSAVNSFVAPGKTELKFLEEELLKNKTVVSLNDDFDFDPRAEEKIDIQIQSEFETLAQRKSSLNLKIDNSLKLVSFIVPPTGKSEPNGKIQKPLTPYYNKNSQLGESVDDFVNPTQLSNRLSDQEFDPRSETQVPSYSQTDLLSSHDDHSIKALTPAFDTEIEEKFSYADPFDTSIAQNIVPGKAELKIIEKEFLPSPVNPESDSKNIDFLAENHDSEIYVKVLTPQLSHSKNSIEEFEIDPFDTSIANNIQPGKAEINLLEKELIN